jgi:hypothetical protein
MVEFHDLFVGYNLLTRVVGFKTVWLGLVLIFGWLDWHCMVGFRTDFRMGGLARLGFVMIFGWFDWHCMVGFVADFGIVELALYG